MTYCLENRLCLWWIAQLQGPLLNFLLLSCHCIHLPAPCRHRRLSRSRQASGPWRILRTLAILQLLIRRCIIGTTRCKLQIFLFLLDNFVKIQLLGHDFKLEVLIPSTLIIVTCIDVLGVYLYSCNIGQGVLIRRSRSIWRYNFFTYIIGQFRCKIHATYWTDSACNRRTNIMGINFAAFDFKDLLCLYRIVEIGVKLTAQIELCKLRIGDRDFLGALFIVLLWE